MALCTVFRTFGKLIARVRAWVKSNKYKNSLYTTIHSSQFSSTFIFDSMALPPPSSSSFSAAECVSCSSFLLKFSAHFLTGMENSGNKHFASSCYCCCTECLTYQVKVSTHVEMRKYWIHMWNTEWRIYRDRPVLYVCHLKRCALNRKR